MNGKTGIFPILPEPKKDIDSNEANGMLTAKQRLVVPIDAAWLRLKRNQIVLTPLGMGGVSYDAVTLQQALASGSGAMAASISAAASSPSSASRMLTGSHRANQRRLRGLAATRARGQASAST